MKRAKQRHTRPPFVVHLPRVVFNGSPDEYDVRIRVLGPGRGQRVTLQRYGSKAQALAASPARFLVTTP